MHSEHLQAEPNGDRLSINALCRESPDSVNVSILKPSVTITFATGRPVETDLIEPVLMPSSPAEIAEPIVESIPVPMCCLMARRWRWASEGAQH